MPQITCSIVRTAVVMAVLAHKAAEVATAEVVVPGVPGVDYFYEENWCSRERRSILLRSEGLAGPVGILVLVEMEVLEGVAGLVAPIATADMAAQLELLAQWDPQGSQGRLVTPDRYLLTRPCDERTGAARAIP